MKILTVNRNYFISGGPEKYLFSLMEKMQHHQFVPFCVDFKRNLETPFSKYFLASPTVGDGVQFSEFGMSSFEKIAYARDSVYNCDAKRRLESLIADEQPDVALFLNAVYFSDSVIDACRKFRVPVLWRVSDFHKVCASYFLYRDGGICEECLDGKLSHAIRHRCGGYQRSLPAAVIKVFGMWMARIRHVYDYVDAFLAPSAFTRELMIRGGFPAERVIHLPTFVGINENGVRPLPSVQNILYVGRISPEKGLNVLLDAFARIQNREACLTIAGEGTPVYVKTLVRSVPSSLRSRVDFRGFVNREKVPELLRDCTCLVVPSLWYENQPNVVLEGMACGRPVVASRLGSLIESVHHGETGFLFEAGNSKDLADHLDEMLSDRLKAQEMGIRAREYVRINHSPAGHVATLEELFRKSILRRSI